MAPKSDSRTKVDNTETDIVVSRTFDAPARIVYQAWTQPELFQRWWVPKSSGMQLLSVEQDVRVGGGYRVTFDLGDSKSMSFFGTYTEVIPEKRLVWTNEEGGDQGAVTTVTFEEKGGRTLLTLRESFPTKEALNASYEGMESGYPEQFDQLAELLHSLGGR